MDINNALTALWSIITKGVVLFRQAVDNILPFPWGLVALAGISFVAAIYIVRSRTTEFSLTAIIAIILFLALKLIGA